jgi:hypothetical protein
VFGIFEFEIGVVELAVSIRFRGFVMEYGRNQWHQETWQPNCNDPIQILAACLKFNNSERHGFKSQKVELQGAIFGVADRLPTTDASEHPVQTREPFVSGVP